MPARVRQLTNHLNGIFRVDASGGQRFVLRIGAPGWRTADDLALELAWLTALARDTDMGAPAPLPTRAGGLVTEVPVAGVPKARRCVLFTWVPETDLVNRLTRENLSRLGLLAARLHAHAATFVPPPELAAHKMDSVLARGEPDVLLGDTEADVFSLETRRVFEQVREQVEGAFAARYADSAGLRVIHNDLHQENVKVWRGRLRPLDFEDAIWGYPVQDIAMTFADLLFYTPLDGAGYEAGCAAFRAGYTSHSAWPEAYPGEIDTFMAGRQLWRANYVARFQRPHARGFTERLAPLLQHSLDTGRLVREPAP